MVPKTFQGVTSEKKVNPDGSNHNYKLGDKWVCVVSKEHIEWTKTHNGPSGFVQPNGKIVSPSNQIPQEVQQPKTPYKYLTLTPEKIELTQEEARITYEIYLAVKAEIIEEQNGPVLGMIF